METFGKQSNGKDDQRIVWTSTTCKGGKAPCLNTESHPTFENPHSWTIEEMDDIYKRFLLRRPMAYTIKWMGLASYMKEGRYAAVLARLRG